MCADPKVRATLLAELRDEIAARRSARTAGYGTRVSQLAVLAVACAALIAVW